MYTGKLASQPQTVLEKEIQTIQSFDVFEFHVGSRDLYLIGLCCLYRVQSVCVCVCAVLPAMKHRDHSWVACCMTLVDSTACEKSCNNSVERRMRSWNCKWRFFFWISLYSTPCKLLLGGRPWFSDSESYIIHIACCKSVASSACPESQAPFKKKTWSFLLEYDKTPTEIMVLGLFGLETTQLDNAASTKSSKSDASELLNDS